MDYDSAPEYIYSPRADEEDDDEKAAKSSSSSASSSSSSSSSASSSSSSLSSSSSSSTLNPPPLLGISSISSSSSSSLQVPQSSTPSHQGSIEVQVGRVSTDGSLISLEEDEISLRQAQIINRVAKKIDLSVDCAHLALLHYKYSEKKINNTYFDDINAIQSTIGIRHFGATFSSSASDFNCLPCLSVCSAKDGFALGCGHFFCRKCWSGHISASVIEKGNECLKTMCMADKCGEALTMRVINELAPLEVSAKWRRIDLINFVTSSTSMTWCPSAGCGRAFECIKKVDIISCSCGMRFCVLCSNPAHSPIDCKTLEKWQAKNSSEEENIKWILVNTKKCPGCSQRIEKGLGCAHMTCNVCRYEFCWLCLGDYRNHTTCNTYKVQELASSNKEVKASLDKYLWYYERSNNHGNAAKFAEKDRLKTSERLRKLQNDAKFDWTNNDFLEQAADILIECRYSLKYSYALGFFMDDGPEKNLFEYLQGELEVYTERLSGFLEAPLVDMSRPTILDNCVAVRQFLKNLEDGIKRGLTNV